LLSTEPTNDDLHREQDESCTRFSVSYILIVNIYIRLGLKFLSFSLVLQLHSQAWFREWSEVFSFSNV